MFANFYGLNIITIAKFKLPTYCQLAHVIPENLYWLSKANVSQLQQNSGSNKTVGEAHLWSRDTAILHVLPQLSPRLGGYEEINADYSSWIAEGHKSIQKQRWDVCKRKRIDLPLSSFLIGYQCNTKEDFSVSRSKVLLRRENCEIFSGTVLRYTLVVNDTISWECFGIWRERVLVISMI